MKIESCEFTIFPKIEMKGLHDRTDLQNEGEQKIKSGFDLSSLGNWLKDTTMVKLS